MQKKNCILLQSTAEGGEKVIFDMRDFEVLRLCGLCRYLPIRLRRRFNLEIFDVKVINTLRKHGLIKLQSDGSGYSSHTTVDKSFQKWDIHFRKMHGRI